MSYNGAALSEMFASVRDRLMALQTEESPSPHHQGGVYESALSISGVWDGAGHEPAYTGMGIPAGPQHKGPSRQLSGHRKDREGRTGSLDSCLFIRC
ncbi:hypothetical protein GCM10017784_32600 [Deinococcus indicus]|nr:hypothetical protein GCM10017784_32600 [Deinococcus indicus]